MRPTYGLDRCAIWRPNGAAGLELVSAPVEMRAFTPRLSFTLGICLKVGEPHVAISDGRRLEITHDTVILRPPGCVWSSQPARVGFLSLDVPSTELPDDATFGAMMTVPSAALPQFASAIRALDARNEPTAYTEATIALVASLGDVGFLRSRLARDTMAPRRLRRAREFLREHLHRPVSLDELSAHCAVNKFVLLRGFRRELGMTPHAFHLQLRVQEARELLARGVPATDVTFRTGFADQSHFGRWFKRVVGVSPAVYARSVRRTVTACWPGTESPSALPSGWAAPSFLRGTSRS